MDHHRHTIESFNKLASAYQEKFMDLDLYNDTYDRFCELVEMPGAKILEIGCGPGNITKYILSKRPDFKIEGIDLAPNMVQLAKENNPQAHFSIMDCREIDQLPHQFNGIIAGFCMPYLSKEECSKLINDTSLLLYPNGIFYLSVIEGDDEKSGYETASNGTDKAYVYYYQEDYLLQELRENGFELIDLTRKDYTKHDQTPSTHLIIIAKKNKE